MPSPEYRLTQPHELDTPVDKLGAPSTERLDPRAPQQSFLPENGLTTSQHPPENFRDNLNLTEEHHCTEQDADSALGLLAQRSANLVKQVENPQIEALYKDEQHPLITINHTNVKRARRTMWQDIGYIPPIGGGQEHKKKESSPNQPDLKRWPQTGGYSPDSEEYRLLKAQELGLPENASWGKIGDLLNQRDMLTIAREIGFSEKQIERLSWHTILTEGVLGLYGNEPIEKVIERIREVKERITKKEERL